jgi:hypothetical protein
MGFFGRVGNLARGLWISSTRPDGRGVSDAELDAELARPARPRVDLGPARQPSPAKEPAPAPLPERKPPERDEHGNIKKTL